MNLGIQVLEQCRTYAARPLLHSSVGTWSYAEIGALATRIATALRQRVCVGDRVALQMPAGADSIAALFACWLADVTPVVIDPRSTSTYAMRWRRHCDTQLCLTDHGTASAQLASAQSASAQAASAQSLPLSELLNDASANIGSCNQDGGDAHPTMANASCSASAIAIVLPTSGSTSSPKAVQLTHDNLLSNQHAWNERYGIGTEDVILATLSLSHSFGITAWLLSALGAGAAMVLPSSAQPVDIAVAAHERRATVFLAVSSLYQYLVRSQGCQPVSFASTRLFLSGACPLPRSAAEEFREKFGQSILQTYGLTEAAPVVTATIPGKRRAGSVGTALANVELKLATETDDVGELCVRGPGIMRGYLANVQATSACLKADGWLHTGDLARLDSDGYVFLVGRSKDLIIRGGNKIYPEEIEDVLRLHKQVRDAAVVGQTLPRQQQVPVAFVVADAPDEALKTQLIDQCRSILADYKIPRRIYWLTHLPRNTNGKLLKNQLRDKLNTGHDPRSA